MVVNRLSFIVPTYVKYNRVDINSLMMLWACGGDNGIGCKVVLFLCHNYLLQNVMHLTHHKINIMSNLWLDLDN
jgi:hypothetical protein